MLSSQIRVALLTTAPGIVESREVWTSEREREVVVWMSFPNVGEGESAGGAEVDG